MLFCKNITKAFGTQVLFDQADFQLNKGERIAVVGRNGSGKSTLGRLILGQDTVDEGDISSPDHYRIAGLDQHLKFNQLTIVDEVAQSLHPGEIHDRWKAEKILSGLGFPTSDFDRSPAEFSGGFQIRIKLAQLLLAEPDCLILDEPTNYLDIVTIRWLERFFRTWKKELICISHDQAFLEGITTHTLAVHRQKFKKIKGSPAKCYSQIQTEEELHERTRKKQELEHKKQAKFIREFRAGARSAGLVQSRIKMLEKKEKIKTLESIPPIQFQFSEAEFTGAKLLDAHNLVFEYEEGNDLLKKLSLEIFPGDKIGIIGANGKGKSTLLRVLNQELQHQSGTLKIHSNTHIGYMGQSNVERLRPEKSILAELESLHDVTEQEARSVAGNLLFSGSLVHKPIKVLSGGERARVNLGKILLSPLNLLLLDEPTNHLDYESVDAFIEAIEHFTGGAVFVSHNEAFLRKVAKKLIVFDGEEVFFYPNDYDTFLAEKGFQSEQEEASPPLRGSSEGVIGGNSKDDRQQKKELERLLRPLKRQLDKIEKEIHHLEDAQKENVEKFKIAERQGNRLKMETLGIEYQNLEKQLNIQWDQWNQVAEEIQNLDG